MSGKQTKNHRCTHEGCNAAFNRPYRLAQHILTHSNVKSFTCPNENCSKSYTSKSHLYRHIHSVHKKEEIDVLFSCPTCFSKFANRQNLKRHMMVKHTLKLPFFCDLCKAEFKKKNHLNAHMYGHTGIMAFSCDLCSKEFISLLEKKKHMRHHKTFTCELCKQVFHQWSKHLKHMKISHSSKEYICNECGRNFKKRAHIIRHIKSHDTIKSYPCPYENCDRVYTRNSNLRQHVIMKHEKLKYECELCDALLSTKAKLRQHMTKIHEQTDPKVRVYKTKEIGRKPRKDMGISKVSMALKLAGISDKKLLQDSIVELIETKSDAELSLQPQNVSTAIPETTELVEKDLFVEQQNQCYGSSVRAN